MEQSWFECFDCRCGLHHRRSERFVQQVWSARVPDIEILQPQHFKGRRYIRRCERSQDFEQIREEDIEIALRSRLWRELWQEGYSVHWGQAEPLTELLILWFDFSQKQFKFEEVNGLNGRAGDQRNESGEHEGREEQDAKGAHQSRFPWSGAVLPLVIFSFLFCENVWNRFLGLLLSRLASLKPFRLTCLCPPPYLSLSLFLAFAHSLLSRLSRLSHLSHLSPFSCLSLSLFPLPLSLSLFPCAVQCPQRYLSRAWYQVLTQAFLASVYVNIGHWNWLLSNSSLSDLPLSILSHNLSSLSGFSDTDFTFLKDFLFWLISQTSHCNYLQLGLSPALSAKLTGKLFCSNLPLANFWERVEADFGCWVFSLRVCYFFHLFSPCQMLSVFSFRM